MLSLKILPEVDQQHERGELYSDGMVVSRCFASDVYKRHVNRIFAAFE